MTKNDLRILLSSPRGFCAGVDRAIQIVEKSLKKFGAPVYVRHEIVHNKLVVEDLKEKGAIFVKELDEIPDSDQPVIFSAHGVPKSVPEAARFRNMEYIDATCPLVSKVHREAENLHKDNYHILLIGHDGHPEVVGTMGQLPKGSITLIEDIEEATSINLQEEKLAFITQTTLSVDDTSDIILKLKERFPHIHSPKKEDICYATTNRQKAVKDIAVQADLFLVLGSSNSSNSKRLVEVALKNGCAKAYLIQDVSAIDWSWFENVQTLGLSAGASAPESVVIEVIETCKEKFNVTIEEITAMEENVVFHVPGSLRDVV